MGVASLVAVLEAGSKVGGRVLHDSTLVPGRSLELGPEFIHGENDNRLLDLVKTKLIGRPGVEVRELDWPNYYWFNKEGVMMAAAEADEQEDVALMHESFERLGEPEAATMPEQSLLQYFVSCGLSSRVLDLADAIFANDYGGDMSDVGLHEVVHEQARWCHGEKYLVLRGACLQDAMDALAAGLPVRTEWKAKTVRVLPPGTQQEGGARAPRVEVCDGMGRVVRAQAAIVTVPLPVLQRGELGFDPPLPVEQSTAVSALRMGNALKVIVRLRRRFWPLDFYDAVCADSFLPEVWLSPAADLMSADSKPPYTMVGFVAGARAERVGRLAEADVARGMLTQLDAMFGTPADPRPASESCDGYLVKNWAAHPLTYGAYSHPTIGASGQRPKLSGLAHGAITFAGEATHEGVNPCVHAAMETGELAAERMCHLLRQRQDGPKSGGGGARSRL